MGIKFGRLASTSVNKNISGFLIWQFSTGSPYVCTRVRNLANFNLAVAKADHQITKFNSPPNFSAIRYIIRENYSNHVPLVYNNNVECKHIQRQEISNSYITGTRDVWDLLHRSTRARSGTKWPKGWVQ